MDCPFRCGPGFERRRFRYGVKDGVVAGAATTGPRMGGWGELAGDWTGPARGAGRLGAGRGNAVVTAVGVLRGLRP